MISRATWRFAASCAGMLVLAIAAMAAGDVGVELKPAGVQAGSTFQQVELTVDNSDGSLGDIVSAVAVRWSEGGPTYLQPLVVSPGARQMAVMRLPAFTVRMEFVIRLLADDFADAAVLAERRVAVDWPEQALSAWPAVDAQLYLDWDGSRTLSTWPGEIKRNVFLFAAIGAVLMSAAALLGRSWLRVGVLVLAACGACAPVWLTLRACPLVQATAFQPEQADYIQPASTSAPEGGADFLAVTSRRTAVWQAGDARMVPIYRNRRLLAAEPAVVKAGEPMSAWISPDDVRLFRFEPSAVAAESR